MKYFNTLSHCRQRWETWQNRGGQRLHSPAAGVAGGRGAAHGLQATSMSFASARNRLLPRPLPPAAWGARPHVTARSPPACARLEATLTDVLASSPEPESAPAASPLPPAQTAHACRTVTLPLARNLPEAIAALTHAVAASTDAMKLCTSGTFRFEVPLPRGVSSLRWLKGQQDTAPFPHVYFRSRRSSAPNTPGISEAEAGRSDWTAVAGVGAACLWQGAAGSGFDKSVVSDMQRWTSAEQPRVKVLGGTRFNPQQQPDAEWRQFGSFCFVLPLVELMECATDGLLACTVAWDGSAAAAAATATATTASPNSTTGGSRAARAWRGATSVDEAASAALGALSLLQPPAPLAAHSAHIRRTSLEHTPTEEQWHAKLQPLLQQLRSPAKDAAAASGAPPSSSSFSGPLPVLEQLEKDMAFQEYMTTGQQGLDQLLSALQSAQQAEQRQARGDPEQAAGAGLDGSSSGGGSAPSVAAAEPTVAAAGSGGSAGSTNGGAAAAPGATAAAMSKVVLARRSRLQLQGAVDPLYLLETLTDRDPRAYQLLLQVDGECARKLSFVL